MSGGSLTIRRRPATTSVSLSCAWSESLVRDFATMDDALDAICAAACVAAFDFCLPAWAVRPAMISSMSTWEYHTSRLPDAASRRISSRYEVPTAFAPTA